MGSALDKALARARDRSATSSTAAPMTPFESYGRRGATRAPAPAPERTGGFGDELSAAIDNWQAGFGHIGGMLGFDSARDWALEQERQAQEALARSSWAQSLDDIEGVGDIPSYLGHLAVQLVPFAGEVVAGAATGGGSLGAKIGLQTLGKATAKKLAKTDAGRAALRRNAARALDTPALRAAPAREARTLAGRQAFNDLSNTTTRRISGAIASYPSSVGQIAGAQQEQAGEYNAAAALALGVPFAGLNLLGIEGAALRGLPRGASQRRALRSLAAAGATSATEGGAEVGQTFLEEVGRKSVDSSHDMLGAEAARRYTEAFVGGAALGGVFGGVSGAATSPKVNTDAILQEAKDRTTQEGDALRRAREGAASLQASTLGQIADVAVGAEVGAGLNSLQYNELTVPAILQQLRDRVAGVNVEGVPEKQLSRAAVEIRKIAADPDAAGTSEWLGRQSELVALASDERAAERATSSATVEEAVAEAYENTVGGFASLDEAQEMLSARLKEAGVPPEMGKKAKALLTRAYRKNNAEAATKILREGFASMRNDANAEVQSRAPAIALAMASMDVLNNIRDINDQRAQAALESEAARLADVAAQQEERDARLSRDAEYRAMQERLADERRAEQARENVAQAADRARRWMRFRDRVFGPQSPEVFTTGTPPDDVASARAVAEQSLSDGTRDMSDVIAEAEAAQDASDTARTLADLALPAAEAAQQQAADIEATLDAEDRAVRTKMLDEVIEKAFSNDAGRNPDVISAFYTALRDKGFKGDRAQATPQELNRMRYALQFRRAELDAGIEPLEVEDAKRQAGEAELVMIEEALANIDASAPQVSGEGVAELEGQIPPADASARVAARQERQSDARQQRPWLRVPPAKVRAVRKALDHYDRVQSKLAADGTTDVKPYSNKYAARNAEQKAELRLLDLIIESNPEASDVDVDNFFNRLTDPEAYPNTRRTLRFDPDRDTDMPGQATEARRKRTPQEQADYDNARRMRAEGRAAAGVVEGVAGIQNRAAERAAEEEGRAAGRAISRAFAEGIRNLEAVAERASLERFNEQQALTEYSDRPFRTAEDERSFSAISKRGGTVVGGVPVSATITFNHEGQDVEVYTAGRPGSEMFYLPQEGGPSIPLGNTLKKATAKFKQVMAAGNVTPAVRTDQSATDVISDAITSRIEQAVAGTQREATSTDTSPDLSDKPVTLRNINAALEEANVEERLVRNKGKLRFEGGDADTWGDLADVEGVRKLSAMSIDEWVGEAITRSEAAMDAAEEAEVAPVDEAMDAGVDPYEGYDEFVDDYEGERALTEFDEGGELEGLEEVEMEDDTGPFEGADEAVETSLDIPSFLDRRGELKEARRTSQHFGPIAVTETFAENVGDVDAALRKELKRMGLGRIKLRIRDKIESSNSETGEKYAIEGSFINDIITVALDAKRGVMSAMKHETIHALRQAGVFTPGEWKALTRYAKRRQKKAMAAYSDLTPEQQLEEAVAVAYQDFFEGRAKPQNMVGRALTKVKNVLAAIGNALTGAGFNSGADILARVESGEVGARAPSQEAGGDISFSTREGRGREFDTWFEGSKIVDDNGEPLTVYHGTKADFDTFKAAYSDGLIFFSTSPEFAAKWPEGSGGLRDGGPDVAAAAEEARRYQRDLEQRLVTPAVDQAIREEEGFETYDRVRNEVRQRMMDRFGVPSYLDIETKAGIRVIPVNLSIKNPFDPRTDFSVVEPLLEKMPSMDGIVDKGLHKEGNWVVYENADVINHLREAGYDGIWLAESVGGPHETIAAFEPEQIKSVFNPMPEGAAQSPQFSRADALDGPMTIDEAGGMTIKPTVTTGSLLNPGNWPSLIRQLSQNQGANVTYGRTHTGLFMSTLPQIEKRYRNDPMVEGLTKWFAGVDKRGAEVSKLMFGVPGEGDTDVTTPRAIRAAWNDMLASDQTKSEHRARDVEDMLYAASNYNVDPRVGVNDEGNLGLDAEQQRTHAILKDRFDKMDKQQQALFDSILKRYRANLEEKHRLLTSLVDDAEGLSAADKRQAKSQLDTMFNERRVYFPQARFGDFIVSARTPAMVDAENEVARRRQTVAGLQDIDADEAQIQAAQQALNDATAEVTNLKENGNYFVSAFDTPAQQKMASEYWTSQGMIARSHTKDQITSALDGVSGNFLARMREEMADVEGGNELLSTMERVYFTTLPETRAAKRALRREGIPGYTKDARRTFEWSMNQDVRQIAELKFREETQTALQEFMDSTKNVPDSHPRKQEYQVLRQIIRKHNQMGLDSEGANTPVQNFANNLAHLWFLGSTPSFLALNLMQPYMMAVPMISAKYGKPGKVSQQIARASKDVASLQWGALKKGLSEGQSVAQALDGEVSASALGAKPAEVELLRYLMDRGLIDLTQVIELAGTISGENQWSRFMHMATKGAHITEKVNRLSVALAAYRTATEANATEADARQFTVDILNESQFNYSGTAAPLLWKTMPGSKVLLQFRKYQQHMAYALVNNFWQAVKGGDPETRRVARQTLTGIVATHGVMAGSLGLPGATFVMAAADAIANTFGDEDEPWDTENELRLLFSDIFGDQAGMMFAKGLPTGAGVDISSRIGLQDIFSPVQTRSVGAEGRQKWNEYMAAMLGPTASIGADFADGMSRLEDDPLKAWELSMPKLVRDLIRGASQASGGVKTRSGMPIIDADDITMGDALGQMLGLPSTKLTETYQSRSTVMTRQKRLQKRRQQLLRRYVEAALDGDTVELSEVMAEMRDYNKVRIKNKEPLIKATDRRNAIRRWQRNEREMVRGNVLPRTQVGMHDRTTPYQTY